MNNKSNSLGEENYYDILGVKPNASKSEIKMAYRKLVFEKHPDKSDDKEEAKKIFAKISKAYQILSNEESRQNYDNHGVTQEAENVIDPSKMFDEMFQEEEIPNVIIPIEATIDDLYTGFEKEVVFPRYSECNKCDATGTKNKVDGECKNCKGRGCLLEKIKGGDLGYVFNEKKCFPCNGSGMDPNVKKCKKCEGNKYIKEEVECDVEIPAGAYNRYFVKFEGEGNFIPADSRKIKDKVRSDVLFVVQELSSNSIYSRKVFINELKRLNQADLMVECKIDFAESLNKIRKEFDYFNNETIAFETNDIISNGDVYVIEDKGMPFVPEERKGNKKRGDLFIKFTVEKPKLNSKQKKRLWQILTDTPYQQLDDVENETIHDITSLDTYIKDKKKENKNMEEGEEEEEGDNDQDSNISEQDDDNISQISDKSDRSEAYDEDMESEVSQGEESEGSEEYSRRSKRKKSKSKDRKKTKRSKKSRYSDSEQESEVSSEDSVISDNNISEDESDNSSDEDRKKSYKVIKKSKNNNKNKSRSNRYR